MLLSALVVLVDMKASMVYSTKSNQVIETGKKERKKENDRVID